MSGVVEDVMAKVHFFTPLERLKVLRVIGEINKADGGEFYEGDAGIVLTWSSRVRSRSTR